MSKIKYVVLFLLLAALGTAFAGGGQEKPKEAVKLTIWIHGADSFIGSTEQQKPQDHQW